MSNGFHGFDALHLACAEAAGADVFVTCDDRLLATAKRCVASMRIRVGDLSPSLGRCCNDFRDHQSGRTA